MTWCLGNLAEGIYTSLSILPRTSPVLFYFCILVPINMTSNSYHRRLVDSQSHAQSRRDPELEQVSIISPLTLHVDTSIALGLSDI
jgi:hypothetical protein